MDQEDQKFKAGLSYISSSSQPGLHEKLSSNKTDIVSTRILKNDQCFSARKSTFSEDTNLEVFL